MQSWNEVYNALNTQEGRGSHHVAQAVMTGAAVQGAAYISGEGIAPCSTMSHGRGELYKVLNTQEGRWSHHAAQAVMAWVKCTRC